MRAKRVTSDDLRKLCPRYGRHTNCKYWFAYKHISETDEWVFKKGIKGECFLEDFCFNESENARR